MQAQAALELDFEHPHEVVDVVGSKLQQWCSLGLVVLAGYMAAYDAITGEEHQPIFTYRVCQY